MIQLRSAIDTYPQCIDVRYLSMEAEYFALAKDATDDFLVAFLCFIMEFLGDQCILDWKFGSRSARFDQIENWICSEKAVLLSADGVVRGRVVSNNSSFRKWLHTQAYSLTSPKERKIPKDYMCILENQLFDVKNGRKSWKEAISYIFSIPDKIPQLPMNCPEIFISASRISSNLQQGNWDGQISFLVPVFCIEGSVNAAAEEMVMFLKDNACQFGNLNARVLIGHNASPSKASPHMTYFSRILPEARKQIPKECTPVSWLYAHYLCGAEWFNVISPLAQSNLSLQNENSGKNPMLTLSFCENRTAFVQSKSSIDTCTVLDLAPIKRLLYDALFPGSSKLPKTQLLDLSLATYWAKPRMWWENIPLFDYEIEDNETDICLIHKIRNTKMY